MKIVSCSFLASVACTLILAGCGVSGADRGASPEDVPHGPPPGLEKARLLYHRNDGIYLRTLGDRSARKLADRASYPRWSPDGKAFAFLRGNDIMLYRFSEKSEKKLTSAGKGRALVFHPSGREVYFTDGDSVRAVDIRNGSTHTILKGPAFMELDIARDGTFLAATVKTIGYRVRRYDLPDGRETEMGRGCSASISPDGRQVTINIGDHTLLSLRDSRTGKERGRVKAPKGYKLDNQKWSNHADWIATVTEGKRQDILIQRATDDSPWRVTDEGDCDRPDLWVP